MVWQSCLWKMVCDKVVCERWCVKGGVWQRWCVKDGVCVWQSCVWKRVCVKVVCDKDGGAERSGPGAGYIIKNKSPTIPHTKMWGTKTSGVYPWLSNREPLVCERLCSLSVENPRPFWKHFCSRTKYRSRIAESFWVSFPHVNQAKNAKKIELNNLAWTDYRGKRGLDGLGIGIRPTATLNTADRHMLIYVDSCRLPGPRLIYFAYRVRRQIRELHGIESVRRRTPYSDCWLGILGIGTARREMI